MKYLIKDNENDFISELFENSNSYEGSRNRKKALKFKSLTITRCIIKNINHNNNLRLTVYPLRIIPII